MKKQTVLKYDAADPKTGMTFNEMQLFALGAMAIDAPSADTVIKVRSTWRGTIRSLQITVEHDES